MNRRICLPLLVASFALAAPAAALAQTSSQAQYQGVAPETQSTGGGGGTAGGGSNTSGASGNGGSVGTGGNSAGTNAGGGSAAGTSGGGSAGATNGSQPGSSIQAPSASSSTSPFTSSDVLLLVLAAVGMVGLGFLLRRTTRSSTPA